jgi:hypothetical protein
MSGWRHALSWFPGHVARATREMAERLAHVDKLARASLSPQEWKQRLEFQRNEARTAGINMFFKGGN